MLNIIIAELAVRGASYHDRKSDKAKGSDSEKHVYHVQMLMFYTAILKIAVQAGKFKNKKRKAEAK